jgi:hypothetical protein
MTSLFCGTCNTNVPVITAHNNSSVRKWSILNNFQQLDFARIGAKFSQKIAPCIPYCTLLKFCFKFCMNEYFIYVFINLFV